MDDLSRLLVAARSGDGAALAAFVQRTQPDVWRFCRQVAGPADADDAVQETYLAAWRALGAYRGEASARTWLFAIARRTAERTAQRRRRWVELAGATPPPSARPSPERAWDVEGLLAALDPDRRMALLLTQVLGLSYAEAAEVCCCPVGTIRSRVARGRSDLLRLTDGAEGGLRSSARPTGS